MYCVGGQNPVLSCRIKGAAFQFVIKLVLHHPLAQNRSIRRPDHVSMVLPVCKGMVVIRAASRDVNRPSSSRRRASWDAPTIRSYRDWPTAIATVISRSGNFTDCRNWRLLHCLPKTDSRSAAHHFFLSDSPVPFLHLSAGSNAWLSCILTYIHTLPTALNRFWSKLTFQAVARKGHFCSHLCYSLP